MRYDIVFHPSWWNLNAGIDFSESFWNDPEIRMEADVVMRRTLHERFGAFDLGEKEPEKRPIMGSDMLACGFVSSQLLGCPVEFAADDAPQVLCANLDDEAAFAIQTPDFDKSPVWQGIERQLRYLKDRFGYVECCIDVNGVQNTAMDLRGQELFLDYYDEDSPARHLLDVSYETVAELCRRLRAYSPRICAGTSNIVSSVLPEVLLHSNCSVEMISNATYEEWLLDYEKRLSAEFQPYGIHHCGQTTEHVIEGYMKTPNLGFIEVGAFSDLKKVVDAVGSDMLVNARYSPARLAQVSSQELRAEIQEMARILPDRRLSISCVGIDNSVSDERVREFCACCAEVLKD